jgi:hypothetical protein
MRILASPCALAALRRRFALIMNTALPQTGLPRHKTMIRARVRFSKGRGACTGSRGGFSMLLNSLAGALQPLRLSVALP